jgi:N-acylneuraminate cytidylyltransferase/CMP-N,N'-diacetyllegionaminic acid synthase
MYKDKSFVAVIPARGGSKGIKNKNIIPLLGRPLMYYMLQAARDSGIIDRIVVSTDSDKIKDVCFLYGVEVIDRPAELAQDDTPTEPVISHALRQLDKRYDYVALLEVTSPLIEGPHILQAAKRLVETKSDIVQSVVESYVCWVAPLGKDDSLAGFYPEKYRRKGRQALPRTYFVGGGIYMGTWDVFANETDFFDTNLKSKAFILHEDNYVDINYGEDLIEAEKRLKRREWARNFLNG